MYATFYKYFIVILPYLCTFDRGCYSSVLLSKCVYFAVVIGWKQKLKHGAECKTNECFCVAHKKHSHINANTKDQQG